MIPGQFDYVRPGNLDETLRILKDREGEAKLLSGGYSLIPLIKLRLAQPALLVDLRDVTGLDQIVETDDYLSIGARATHRQIHENDMVRDRYPLLHDVTATIGDPQVRNWGTIGGSVAHADPASDWPAALIAGNATIVCRSQTGSREIASRDFFIDTFQTAIEPTEVLTEIRVVRRPRLSARRVREARAQGRRLRDRRCRRDRLAGRGRSHQARGDRPDRGRQRAVRRDRRRSHPASATRPRMTCSARPAPPPERSRAPSGDVRGPVEYKRAMAAELTLRALRRATERALAYA